jgi:hypothetical protein
MLTSTARLKHPVAVPTLNLLFASPSRAGEFSVELAFNSPKLWQITTGFMQGTIIKETDLDFSVEPIEDGMRPCSQCGRLFKSDQAFSHCEDHQSQFSPLLSVVE